MGKLRYKILADFFFILHFLWIVLLLGGAVFLIYHSWYAKYHLIILSGTLLLNLFLGGCPITWWEEKYRKMHNPDISYYRDSFIATYFNKLFRWDITPKQANLLLFLIKVASYSISVLVLTKVV